MRSAIGCFKELTPMTIPNDNRQVQVSTQRLKHHGDLGEARGIAENSPVSPPRGLAGLIAVLRAIRLRHSLRDSAAIVDDDTALST
jgi:hypothetical protein